MPDPYHSSSRYPRIRPDYTYREVTALLSNIAWSVVLLVGALIAWQHFGSPLPAQGRPVTGLAMPEQTFRALRDNSIAWEFTWLVPYQEQLTLKSTAHRGAGEYITASYDLLTDGQPGWTCQVGPTLRAPLFASILRQPSNFFGVATMPTQGRKYRQPSDWPYVPLFFFATEGPLPHQRYVLAFGGERTTGGQLPAHVEPVQAAVNGLKSYVQSQQPGGSTGTSTSRSRPGGSAPSGATSGGIGHVDIR